MGSLVRWRVSFALLRRAIRTSLLRCSDGRRESGIIIFLNGLTQGCHQYHIRIHPWTMFFYGVRASSKPSVAPPKRAMIADALELLPSQMALSLDRTVFYNATTQRSRHLIGITRIDGQLVGNLLIRHIQPHKIQTQDPHFQRLMMSRKDGVGQVIKALGTVVALIALTGRFRVIKATPDDVFGLTRGTLNAVGPAQLTNRLITLHLVDKIRLFAMFEASS